MGYLSRYFLKYFKGLNPEENYIIAPQAQSKYYVSSNFKHMSFNWWKRRKEAHSYIKYFFSKNNIKYNHNSDFFVTNLINFFIK